MPVINIVLAGKEHYDPAPWDVVLKQIVWLITNHPDQNIIVGGETPCDLPFEEILRAKIENIKFAEDILQLKKLLGKGKITLQDKKDFIKNCQMKAIFESNFDRIVLELLTDQFPEGLLRDYPRDKRAARFYNFLKTCKPAIPYYGIDVNRELHQRLEDAGQEELNTLELPRMTAAAKNILNALKPLMATGGFMFVMDLGMVHVQRLDYLIKKAFEKMNVKGVVINIIPLRFFSQHHQLIPQTLRVFKEFKQILSASEEKDTPEMLREYKKYPARDLLCVAGAEEDDFVCEEFNKIIQSCFSKSKIIFSLQKRDRFCMTFKGETVEMVGLEDKQLDEDIASMTEKFKPRSVLC